MGLQMLLRHACKSLAAFGEGIKAGRVGLDPATEGADVAADPAGAFRERAGQLLAAGVFAAAAALEVAVHWWDISRAGSTSRSRAPWPPDCRP
jgi:hypothetical protein